MSRFLEEPTPEEPEIVEEEFLLDRVANAPRRHKPSWGKSLLAVLLSLVVVVGGGYLVYSKVHGFKFSSTADYPGPGEQDVTVTIIAGSTISQIADTLVEADVVASSKGFVRVAEDNPAAASIQAGSYVMKTKMKSTDALGLLVSRTTMVSHNITLREGLRNSEVVASLTEQSSLTAEHLNASLADPAALGIPEWGKGNPEGFLFPETYTYDNNTTSTQMLVKMTAQFDKISTSVDFVNQAKARGIDPYDALIVASIIEKEVNNQVYANDVAQVLYNRLAKGMKLQLDSTVIYAVNSPGTITTTDEERANDSPYNTYVHEGLPPGPISNPGQWALAAAVNPTSGDYLYFVAVNPDTGETKFANDWAGHEANVALFQQWCQSNPDRCS